MCLKVETKLYLTIAIKTMLYKKKKKKSKSTMCFVSECNYMVIFNILYLELNHLKGT